jgi:hypothetical protein
MPFYDYMRDRIRGVLGLSPEPEPDAQPDEEPDYFKEADECLRAYLRGEEDDGRWVTNYRNYLYIVNHQLYRRTGGWQLAQRDNGVYLLSLDTPMASHPTIPAQYWRDRFMHEAKKAHAPVLPYAREAFRQARSPKDPAPKVIETSEAMESVFTIGDRYYLSGYDDQEEPPLYFLCRLPHPVSGIAEAREALKPPSVVDAEAGGIQVERQGDIFAVESNLTDADIETLGGEIFGQVTGPAERGHHWPPSSRVPIYGTAHTSHNIAVLPDGILLAKGPLVHAPSILGESRRRDHQNRPLGDGTGWWWLTRNTVPKTPPPESPMQVSSGPLRAGLGIPEVQAALTELAEAIENITSPAPAEVLATLQQQFEALQQYAAQIS